MDRKKIAVIGLKGLPATGGAAAVGENIINQLSDKYDFTVYSISSHTDLQTGSFNGLNQIVFKSIPLLKLNTLLYYIKACFHVLFVSNYHLIHLHHSDAAFIIPLLRLKYKVVVTTHGVHIASKRPKWKRYKWFFQIQMPLLNRANVVTCVSKVEKKWFLSNLKIDAHYIPNGINIPQNIQEQIVPEKYIFFGAGRIIKTKGAEILLGALNKMDYTGKIIIAGNINHSKDYKAEILGLAKSLNVDFVGLIKDKNQLLTYIHNSKLFVFPSSMEAMSMMLLEAASVKAKIVCSDIEENKDVFTEDEVLFFQTDNINDLIAKIHYAFVNENLMIEKSQKGFQKLVNNYTWDSISKEYDNIYCGLMAN